MLALALLLLVPAASAQDARSGKPVRIGRLSPLSAATDAPHLQAFRRALGNLGWREGTGFVIEERFADGKPERLGELAAELVRRQVDLILVDSTPGALAVKMMLTWQLLPGATATVQVPGLAVKSTVLDRLTAVMINGAVPLLVMLNGLVTLLPMDWVPIAKVGSLSWICEAVPLPASDTVGAAPGAHGGPGPRRRRPEGHTHLAGAVGRDGRAHSGHGDHEVTTGAGQRRSLQGEPVPARVAHRHLLGRARGGDLGRRERERGR